MFKYLLSGLLLLFSSTAFGYECNEEIDNLSKEYKIPIYCKLASIEYDGDPEMEEAEQELIDKATFALRSFLDSYDKRFLFKAKLTGIFIFKNIKYLDSKVGGFSDGENIWLSLRDIPQESCNTKYVKVLHHEFSSNIYNQVSYVKKLVWKKLSHAYHFTVNFLKKCLSDPKYAFETTEDILEKGFLRNYSMTNDENDFNIYAEMLFARPQEIKTLKEKYPNVKIKLDKLKEYYRELGFKGKFPDET